MQNAVYQHNKHQCQEKRYAAYGSLRSHVEPWRYIHKANIMEPSSYRRDPKHNLCYDPGRLHVV